MPFTTEACAASPAAGDACDAAARRLVAARHAHRRLTNLPKGCRPTDFHCALAIQRRVGELLHEHIAGWKCALPSPGRVIVAPIYHSVVASGSRWRVLVPGPTARIEPEIALVLDRDLPPITRPYQEDDVRLAVGTVRLALELLGSRYAEPEKVSFAELLADGLFNAGLYVGPEIARGLQRDFGAVPIDLVVDGAPARRLEGRHPDGNPIRPLLWLANFLSERGEGLSAGHIIITGSYAGVLEVPIGARLRIGFGDLGSVSVQLSAEE